MAIRNAVSAVFLLGFMTAPILLSSCAGPEPGAQDEIHVVKVEGAAMCYNYSLSPFAIMFSEEGVRPAGLLAKDGDLIVFAEGDDSKGPPFLLRYRVADGESLSVGFEAGRMLLNGKTVSLILEEEDAWQWLEKASTEDLRNIRTLGVGGKIDIPQMEILKKVARANPEVSLWLGSFESPETDEAAEEGEADSAPASPQEVLRLFRPRWLMVGNPAIFKETEQVRSVLQDVEVLLMLGETTSAGEEAVELDFLADLPRLRSLTLQNWSAEKAPLPRRLKTLWSLMLIEGDMPADLSPIAHLTGLEELMLVNSDVEDVGTLARFPNLRTVSLVACENVTDLSPLKGLPLRYLSFPPKISQEQFDAAIEDHPALQAVELFGCENITDISRLKDLRGLKALVLIRHAEVALEPLREMKGLRLLILPADVFTGAPDEIAELEEALPDCLIVPGGPLCLGSGWILVLVPVVVAAWGLANRRRKKVQHGR